MTMKMEEAKHSIRFHHLGLVVRYKKYVEKKSGKKRRRKTKTISHLYGRETDKRKQEVLVGFTYYFFFKLGIKIR
ncbi:hypothetical protein MtrunA17_Chr2g0292381 [Medicago truncatula]|uniref:Uncharacterized protein n=1 Tax=Medicago truncatula TaxID=3880 RepID=A0A396J488_MEDTR|nr:hypothetical protein MtrunA17_Chr2g0292381 [Medicago truncatula]